MEVETLGKMAALKAHLQFWQDFSLSDFHRELDGVASAIAARQDESELSRRKLVEKSKEFKRTSSEEVRHEVSPLMKAFQSEVDALTKRSKAAETAFLTSYKRLIDLPDPIPILEQAVTMQVKLEKAQDCEIENKQLRETLKEYNSEFAQVKNQDVTINRLRDQLKSLEDELEARVEERVRSRVVELAADHEEQERGLQCAREEMQQRMAQGESKFATMRQALEATQSELIELKNKFDVEAAARTSELEIVMTDLDRANQRAELAERELEMAKEAGALAPHHSTSQTHLQAAELEAQLHAKDQEILQLFEANQKLQGELAELRSHLSRQVAIHEGQLADKSGEVERLRQELAAQQDYAEVKRELRIMKSVELMGQGTEELGDSSSKPLEVLLLEKNKGLQNEITSMKKELAELHSQLRSAEREVADLRGTVSSQQALVAKLEGDLLHVQPLLAGGREGEVLSSPSLAPAIMADALKSSILLPEQRPLSTSGAAATSAESLLPIVSSQRERFKQRNAELEAENRHQKETASHLQQEADRLRADNVKLYEKIKFLQSYPSSSRQPASLEDETTGRYASQYEARLDPFSAFGQKERRARYNKLSGPEKATLNLSRMILSNKIARTVAFFYAIIVHVLILVMLFKLASAVDCSRDMSSEWAQKYLQHMQLAHADHFGGAGHPAAANGGGGVHSTGADLNTS